MKSVAGEKLSHGTEGGFFISKVMKNAKNYTGRNRICKTAMFFVFLIASQNSLAQHTGHDKSQHRDTISNSEKSREDTMMMTHAFSLNLLMNRNSSGTAWHPDATPVYGYVIMRKKWNMMFHGSVFF